MKLLLLSRYDRRGASSRIRSYQYIPYLNAVGIEVKTRFLFDDPYVRDIQQRSIRKIHKIATAYARRLFHMLDIQNVDGVWIEKELFPWLPGWVETVIRKMRIPCVVDYDDAIFHRYDKHPWYGVRCLLGRKIDRIMAGADLVLAGNHYLEQRAMDAGAREVTYLPSVIDIERYGVKKKQSKSIKTIGWIGSPTTARYLKMVAAALETVSRKHDVRIVLVGAGRMTLNNLNMTIKPWHEDTEVNDILDFDIGIMPLPETPWSRGKCGYKLIQYMACGIPVVASPVEANKDIVINKVNGFMASGADDWLAALERLLLDDGLRERMGRQGRKTVESKFCLQVTAPCLKRVLIETIGKAKAS